MITNSLENKTENFFKYESVEVDCLVPRWQNAYQDHLGNKVFYAKRSL